MPSEIVDNPLLMIVVLLLVVIACMTFERFLSEKRRQAWRESNRWRWQRRWGRSNFFNRPPGPKPEAAEQKQPDAADQLRIIMAASFTIQPLLNKNEARVFRELDRFVISCNPSWQVMAQDIA